MEAIKHSKIIVILLIIYTGIAILVVTLDQKKSTKKSSEETKEENEETLTDAEQFILKVEDVNVMVIDYITENNISNDICIPLSQVVNDATDGSAYYVAQTQSVKMWYKEDSYAINNIETNLSEITEEDIESTYNTDYYNTCGLNN